MPYPVEVYDQLRRSIGDVEAPQEYEDAELDLYLDAVEGDVNSAASDIWREKASRYAELVDITEAGSSRKNSSLYDHAIKQSALFGAGSGEAGGEPGVDFSTTRKIVRP